MYVRYVLVNDEKHGTLFVYQSNGLSKNLAI